MNKRVETELKKIIELDFDLIIQGFTLIEADPEKDILFGQFVSESNKAYNFYIEGSSGRPYLQRSA